MNPGASMWNERYGEEPFAYGTAPNEFFKSELDLLPAGTLLLPAEGEGRNAVYARQQGWEVVCFDQSTSGRDKALRLAKERNVSLDGYHIADIRTFETPHLMDAIAYSYVHLPAEFQTAAYARLNAFVRPGGTLIYEGFSTRNFDKTSGGPKKMDMLMTVEKCFDLFEDFSNVEVWEEEIILDEGLYHRGEAVVIRARGIK